MAARATSPLIRHEDHDPHEHEGCYIFSSEASGEAGRSGRPGKRRKVSHNANESDIGDHVSPLSVFKPLLNGAEGPEFVKLRRRRYLEAWGDQEDRFKVQDFEYYVYPILLTYLFDQNILRNVNATTLDEVAAFVARASSSNYDERIPTGLVVAGPSIASHGHLFQQITDRIKADGHGPAVVLRSGDASNLKTLLKLLIARLTSQTESDEDELEKGGKDRKLLNYDLQLLHDYVVKKRPKRVLVTFQDTEGFDGNLLVEAVGLLRSWLDRIPFVVLFGIATSVEIFHQKLPDAAIRCLRGERFDVERTEESLERLFNDAVGQSSLLRTGPSISAMLLDRQRDHVQSVDAFVNAIKYSYMSHYFANPLSIFTAKDMPHEPLQAEHFEALRSLRSFRNLAEDALDNDDVATVRSLLQDDDFLRSRAVESIEHCKDVTTRLLDAIRIVFSLRSCLANKKVVPMSELYIKAVSGELQSSPMVREMLLIVKRMPSDGLTNLLSSLGELQLEATDLPSDLAPIAQELEGLIATYSKDDKPLRSEHEVTHQSMRTTVVAQRVELSKRKSALSDQETAYSRLVQRVCSVLEDYFSANLGTNPQTIFCHELLFYDLKGSHRDAFAPKPRFAIERALSAPHDYLDCSCCMPGEALSASQPPTAILYQLYLESGALINVSDLWSAFYTILGGEDGEDCDERNALALFYRALAELKHMGMVKNSRKKTDHVAKLAWKGL